MAIDIATGNLHFSHRDVALPGRFPLRWERNFSSHPNMLPSPLGPGWSSPFFAKLTRVGTEYRFFSPPGGLIVFPDPENRVDHGEVVRALGHFHEITKHGFYLRITKWNPESRAVTRYIFRPDRNGQWWPLMSLEDSSGQGLDLAWNDRGQLNGVRQRLEKRTLIFGYSELGYLASVAFRFPDGRTQFMCRYEYGKDGRLNAAYDALNHADRYEYDPEGRLIREVSKDGGVFAYKYDDKGRCIRTSGLDGYDLKSIRYMDHIGFSESTDSYGKTTRYQWKPSGQVFLEMDPMGGAFGTEYDEFGRIIKKTDPMDGITEYAYDESGNRCGITDALGNRISFGFNKDHQVVSYTDKAGGEWIRAYDASGRITSTVNPLGAEYKVSYDPRGLPVLVTAPDGSRKSRTYSESGELTEETDWQGKPTRYRYDAMGRRVRVIAVDGGITEYTFDLLGQLTGLLLPSGSRFHFTYDAGGNRTSVTDFQGRKTSFRYGACRRILERIDRGGARIKYRWGTEPGRLLGLTNQKGEEYAFFHDACGRVIGERSFDGRESKYEFDVRGHKTALINAMGERIAIETNPLGQVVRKNLPDGSSLRFEYDKLGNLIAAESPDGMVSLMRDAVGRVVKEDQESEWVENRFGIRGRVTGSRSSRGREFDIRRDESGNVSEIELESGELIRFERDTMGRETRRELPGDLRLDLGYDGAGRLTSQAVFREAGIHSEGGSIAESRIQRDYEYESGGKVRRLEDSRRGGTVYTYDLCDRLLGAVGNAGRESFDYSADGNITSAHRDSGDVTLTYGPGDRLASMGNTAFTYDLQGRLVSRTVREASGDRTWSYGWNALDQLRSLTSPEGSVWTYHYDALGRRIRKEGPEGSIRYIWDRDTIIHEIPGNGAASTWIYQDKDFAPLASIQGGKIHLAINDHLGTPKELIGGDGAISWSARYGAWGDLLEQSGSRAECPIRFQGQWFDKESGLHYNNFRYYDPAGMRYISSDPIALRGGTNLYAYASNPINLLDPMGLCEEFPNQLPDELPAELERADALGVRPMSPSDPGFEAMVNSGRVKWVVTTDGELRVIPHSIDGQGEIPHTAASRGEPVLAAGEADIAGSDGQFFGTDIDNHSGHYKPSEESTQTGRDAFGSHGITFP